MPNVTLYTKPFCPYCVRAMALLEKKGVEFTEIEAAFDPNETDRPIGQTEVALRQRLVADRVRSEQLIDGGGSSAEPQARPARVPSFSELEQRAAATPDGEDEDRYLPIHELGDGSGSR